MPPVPYTARPFVGDRFEPRGRLADYARANGRDVADAIRAQGANSAALWSGIGQNVSGSLRDIAAYPEQQRQAAMLAQRQQREEQAYQEQQTAKQTQAAKAQRLRELTQEHGGRVPSERLVQEFGPEDAADIDKAFDELFPAPKPAEPYTLTEGGQRFGPDNKLVAENPKPLPVAPIEKPPSVGSFEDFVTAKYGPRPTPEQIVEARKSYQQADDRPRIVMPSGPRPMTQTAEAALITRLAKDWTAQSKPTRELERQVRIMDAGMDAVRRGDLSQGAQQVLVTFQKILDPPSVVRDSEFWRSANGQSMLNRVRGAMERLSKGGVGVTADELQKFAELARATAKAQQGSYLDRVKKRIGATADRYNIPQELIFEAPEEEHTPNYLSSDPDFGTPVAPVKPKGGK